MLAHDISIHATCDTAGVLLPRPRESSYLLPAVESVGRGVLEKRHNSEVELEVLVWFTIREV